MSPTGVDTAAGTSAAPWLTPNHNGLRCGVDTITAVAATNYNAASFGAGQWGTVSCSGANNVVWVQCATFDACKVASATTFGIQIGASYWGVQGFEVTTTASGFGTCFSAAPYTSTTTIHHIIFANNVARVCQGGGVGSYNNGAASVDYFAIVGNIVYSATNGANQCFSGISIYQPANYDTAKGTHIFVDGNFAYANLNPASCSSNGVTTDADGLIFDTFDRSAYGGAPYTGDAVGENNLIIGNGGKGIESQSYTQNATTYGNKYFFNNTLYGDNKGTIESTNLCAEALVNIDYGVTYKNNLIRTTAAKACPNSSGAYQYAVSVWYGTGTTSAATVSGNDLFAASGMNTSNYPTNDGFTFGTNAGTDPVFASAGTPGSPNCTGKANVVDCMSTTLTGFTPTVSSTTSYGYQKPVTTQVADAYFPTWLCNANLPSGIVSTPCSSVSNLTPAFQGMQLQGPIR